MFTPVASVTPAELPKKGLQKNKKLFFLLPIAELFDPVVQDVAQDTPNAEFPVPVDKDVPAVAPTIVLFPPKVTAVPLLEPIITLLDPLDNSVATP